MDYGGVRQQVAPGGGRREILETSRFGERLGDPLVGQSGAQRRLADGVRGDGLVDVEARLVLGDEDRPEVADGRPLTRQRLGGQAGACGGTLDGTSIRSRDVLLDEELSHGWVRR